MRAGLRPPLRAKAMPMTKEISPLPPRPLHALMVFPGASSQHARRAIFQGPDCPSTRTRYWSLWLLKSSGICFAWLRIKEHTCIAPMLLMLGFRWTLRMSILTPGRSRWNFHQSDHQGQDALAQKLASLGLLSPEVGHCWHRGFADVRQLWVESPQCSAAPLTAASLRCCKLGCAAKRARHSFNDTQAAAPSVWSRPAAPSRGTWR